MRTFSFSARVAGTLAVLAFAGGGCVADRPARNGVFNENQYVRKDFLIQGTDTNGNAAGSDPGWLVRATITETSTPNLLGSAIDLWGGAMSDVNLVRFRVTQDKLQMLSMIQLSNPVNTAANNGSVVTNNSSVTEDVVNVWPATNVDLKYRVNLDGETTNFYEENQELDWEVRQWVKLQFDKNDFSDVAPMGLNAVSMINQCADVGNASATLVTDSFILEGADDDDLSNDYMEFTVQVSLPMNFTDDTCITAYGPMAQTALDVGRTSVTLNLKYSFKRATPVADLTYKPFILAEKDPIRTKYGPLMLTTYNRDDATGLIAANQYVERYDPTKPIVWYFDQNFPQNYKCIFRKGTGCPTGPGVPATIEDATNTLLKASSAANPTVKAQVSFQDYNAGGITRTYGDIRYNFLRWASDQDIQDSFAGVTMAGVDPRTGEIVNQGIEFNDFAVLSYYAQRIDAFLVSVGASPGLNGPVWVNDPIKKNVTACTVGQTLPIVDQTDIDVHDASDTLFTKMQLYLNLNGPNPADNHLGPKDFADTQNENDPNFIQPYLAVIPYQLFADPAMNLFVTPEGEGAVFGPSAIWADLQNETTFQANAATINAGQTPYTPDAQTGGVYAAASFVNQMRSATDTHLQLQRTLQFVHPNEHRDVPDSFSLETVMEQDSRQCTCPDGTTNCGKGTTGTWETKQQWEQHIIDTYWQQVFWHEFGHSMSLDHNFMGSIDQNNFTAQRDAKGDVLCDNGTSSGGTCPTGHTLYDMYSSSIMEYASNPARLAWTQGWGYYDAGAITWVYANDAVNTKSASAGKTVPQGSRSGQVDATYPYFDPNGFCFDGSNDCNSVGPTISLAGKTGYERRFLRCDATHEKYSPFCREGDTGVTPSEIIANQIDNYEWQYQWRNFRNYNKVWSVADYANNVAATIVDMRRFLSSWYFDWNPGDITDTLHRIGIVPPPNSDGTGSSANDYYNVVTQAFFTEMSKTNQMVAAFDEALIQQAAGERPYATVYDDFYGDETQQGIILDKFFAMQSFVGLWASDNYDQNQAGTYISSWGDFGFDASYNSVAQTAVRSMVGTQYASYPYFIPTAVALFAQDTHSPSFVEVVGTVEGGAGGGSASPFPQENDKDWIGGWVFYRQEDLINFFRTVALNACANNSDTCLPNCTDFESCTYDVTNPAQVNQNIQGDVPGNFIGPDGFTYAYAYIATRNEWIVAREDRNIVTWTAIENFNSNLYQAHDDGSNGQYQFEYELEYTIDAYEAYEQEAQTSDNAGGQVFN